MFRQESDNIGRKPVLLAVAATALVSAGYIVLAWALDTGGDEAVPWAEIPDEVNEVELAPFDEPTAAERGAVAAESHLKSYGYVDRDAGIVHIPIDRAAELFLRREGDR